MEYLFIIKFSTRGIDLKKEIAFFDECETEFPDVTIPHKTMVDQPAKGVVAIVSFPDDASNGLIEEFCDRVRDHVAEINELIFDDDDNVLIDGNNIVTDKERHFLTGFADLARWAHAPMRNVITGFGSSYNGNFDPDTEDNSYEISTLKGGSGGKH